MRWFKIDKSVSVQPSRGVYSDWKSILAEEGMHQCVYCALPESLFGGIRNFHVEHYKPKSVPEFSCLTNIITNLFYSCPVCNTFKGDDWPCEPDDKMSIACYPSPAVVDYNRIFLVQGDFSVAGHNLAARYMVERLYLNRPHLITERRKSQVELKLDTVQADIERYWPTLRQMAKNDHVASELLHELVEKQQYLIRLLREYKMVIPYHHSDISRA